MVRIVSEDNEVIQKPSILEEWQKNLRGLDDVLTCPRPDNWWTGKKPVLGTPGVLKDGTITALPLVDLSTCTRQQVLDYFENRWCLSEVLFSALKGEAAFYKPPYHQLRHPLIFYYCHPAALYINKLRVAGILKEGINAYFEELFETGVDEMSWDDLSKNSMQWPSVSEVTQYRRQTYETVKNVILTHPEFDNLPITMDSQLWALFMGFEHENIHIDTSSVLMREMPAQYLVKPNQWPVYGVGNNENSTNVPKNQFLKVERGQAVLGKPTNFPSFGWDNEYGELKFMVDEFEASQNLVSNGEFLEFLKSGGYHKIEYWSEQGWKWRTFRNAKWPTFWIPDGPAGLHQYKLRLLFEELDYLPLDLPAVVNHHEAKAYCNWLTQKQQDREVVCRLLTEAEHHRLRTRTPINQPFDPVMKFTGDQFKNMLNLNLAYGSETPVQGPQNQFNQYEDFINSTKLQQFNDVFGNLWQWCEDYFAALPDSNGVHPYYDDFSTPCYDGQHNIIMGGSFISTGQEASIYARYHFRPHFFQHAGFRVVRSRNPPQLSHVDSPPPHVGGWNPSSNNLNNDNSIQQKIVKQILLHYSNPVKLPINSVSSLDSQITWSQSVVNDVLKMVQCSVENVLIVGCGVGGIAFAMAEVNPNARVIAVDANDQFISIARDIQANNDLNKIKKMSSSQIQFPSQHAQQVEFKWMDPVALAPDLGEFDLVIMDGVLESTTSPKGPLKRMGGERGLVRKPNGALAVISRYDWDEEICDKKLWLSANKGDEKEGVQGLKQVLQNECSFELVDMSHVPAIFQTSGRIFEVQDHHLTMWRRT